MTGRSGRSGKFVARLEHRSRSAAPAKGSPRVGDRVVGDAAAQGGQEI